MIVYYNINISRRMILIKRFFSVCVSIYVYFFKVTDNTLTKMAVRNLAKKSL